MHQPRLLLTPHPSLPMRPQLTVRLYCAAVFVAGVAVAAMAGTSMNIGYVAGHPVTFALLASGVVLAEALPVKIPRRGQDEEITLSTSFSMALLLVGGLGPALVAQGVASVIQDVASRKPGWRVRFNLGQYILALAAAYDVLW